MEKALVGLGSGFASTFSLHSLADSSNGPAISEAEEIHEVKSLVERGEKAFMKHRFADALRCYNEALDIDELSVESMAGRAAVHIETGNFSKALADAERLLALNPNYTQGYYLRGVALHSLGEEVASLHAFLQAVDLEDVHSPHLGRLTSNVASIVARLCPVPEKLLQKVADMDSYKKLCEVGSCLYKDGKFELCIKVLQAAQRLQTNQQGITMKIQLTLANAYAALKQNALATSSYQECVVTSVSAHDPQYQVKALVSLASLFLEMDDTHQAIIHYEKLQALQTELQNEDPDAPLPEYWSQNLRCALHLNLSIAYKTIGNMNLAVHHAEKYVQLVKDNESKPNAEAQSHYNIGMLHEIRKDFPLALEHYLKYLELSKAKSDKKGVAQAYGCLGSVYAQLSNVGLSKSYHEQHVQFAKQEKDVDLLTIAHEQFGDTYMTLKMPEKAVDEYTEMYQECKKSDLKTQTTGLCKLGNAYKTLKRYQYAMYYYEQALELAKERGFESHKIMCKNQLANILQYSTQVTELEKSRDNYENLIPLIEARIQQHKDEGTFCPTQLLEQLDECYDGMQNVLCKLGDQTTCLNYAEARKKKPMQGLAYGVPGVRGAGGTVALYDAWTLEKINRVVSQQNSTVVYYSLLEGTLMIWVLQPGTPKPRFYSSSPPISKKTWPEILTENIAEIRNNRDIKELQYECENRSLPLRDIELERLRQQNQKLGVDEKEKAKEEYREELAKEILGEEEPTEKEKALAAKPPQRRLFDFLLAPVYDAFCDLDDSSPLLFIPDKELFDCPFGVIQDWAGRQLYQKFKITVIPSLFALDRAVQNEMNMLKIQDELECARNRARFGGIMDVLATHADHNNRIPAANTPRTSGTAKRPGPSMKTLGGLENISEVSIEDVNLRRISNPRLLTSGAHKQSLSPDVLRVSNTANTATMTTRDNTSLSSSRGSRSPRGSDGTGSNPGKNLITSLNSAPLPAPKPLGSPTNIETMVKAHTLNTLVSKTWTNTDVTSSLGEVVAYQQISSQERCVVIGSPCFEQNVELYGRPWKPVGQLKALQRECHRVAEMLGCEHITGEDATKQRAVRELRTATVIHIATVGCLREGMLAFTPNPLVNKDEAAPQHSYCLTADEIAATKMSARLVVISGGWSFMDRDHVDQGYVLPGAFIAAGAQCVLTLLWPLPDRAVMKLYHHLYTALQEGTMVTMAVRAAMDAMQEDDRYSARGYWSPYLLIGKDVHVDLKTLRHHMLDQTLDRVEEEYAEENNNINPLNPAEVTPNVAGKEENLVKLQENLMRVTFEQVEVGTEPILALMDMLDGALKRLHITDNLRRTTSLPAPLRRSMGGLKLLRFLGFHFQAPITSEVLTEKPYVLYPHSNADNSTLMQAYDAIKALIELDQRKECIRCLHELLPLAQEHISYMVDMLCLTKHAGDLQLKASDLSIKPLWRNLRIRAFLAALGFHQVGLLLNFTSIPSNRKLLSSALQLFLALSIHKNNILLHKLDVNMLGPPPNLVQGPSMLTVEGLGGLPSLTPLLLPRNQLRMSTPWLTFIERPREMDQKMQLAKSKSDLKQKYRKQQDRAKTWHQSSVQAQADEQLEKYGRPVTSPPKLKVKPASHVFEKRRPIEEIRELEREEVDERRDYAHYVYQQRLTNVAGKHRDAVRKLYLPYISS